VFENALAPNASLKVLELKCAKPPPALKKGAMGASGRSFTFNDGVKKIEEKSRGVAKGNVGRDSIVLFGTCTSRSGTPKTGSSTYKEAACASRKRCANVPSKPALVSIPAENRWDAQLGFVMTQVPTPGANEVPVVSGENVPPATKLTSFFWASA